MYPPDTWTSFEQVRMPESKKELQHALGLLAFWRKHIPDFSVIAQPLHDLIQRRTSCNWATVHEEALKLLISEAEVYQALGSMHPTDHLHVE